ncbi:MAG: glycosyltransferase [Candidatus Sulfotelmatobacter sp.]
MITVAYLANCFPAGVEPYVSDEIQELRRRGVRVIAGSVRKSGAASQTPHGQQEILHLQPLRIWTLLRALGLAARRWRLLSGLLRPALKYGNESTEKRWKALLHTGLGAYYAVQLEGREVVHIHVHHGYFGSWIAMVAAQLLGVSYSLTLHGSDLLVHGAYLDTKLKHCQFCTTISEYNHRYILRKFPAVEARKVNVLRLGVEIPARVQGTRDVFRSSEDALRLLAVGRLHEVKDHAFLIRACARLRDGGLKFECAIAGEGPERDVLAALIREKRLQDRVALLGHVGGEKMDALYRRSDAVVLTSRSEGIPLVLMEAMSRNKPVLAPALTGIPELVIPGKTGFLYQPGQADDFMEKIFLLRELIGKAHASAIGRLDWVLHAARLQVQHNFNRDQNLSHFCDQLLEQIAVH